MRKDHSVPIRHVGYLRDEGDRVGHPHSAGVVEKYSYHAAEVDRDGSFSHLPRTDCCEVAAGGGNDDGVDGKLDAPSIVGHSRPRNVADIDHCCVRDPSRNDGSHHGCCRSGHRRADAYG